MRIAAAFLFLTAQAFGAFSYSRMLSVDHTKCGASNASNFPVLVSISNITLKTVANGGHIQHAATQTSPAVTMPADLVFAADAAGSTKYAWEVESYDGTNGILIAWVKIPTVSHTVDTSFYMLYGDATIATAQNTGSYSPQAVWDANYVSVWHLGNTLTNSVSGGAALANTGSVPFAAGSIGQGVSFNGTSQYLSVATSPLAAPPMTVEAWVYDQNGGVMWSTLSSGIGGNWNGWYATQPGGVEDVSGNNWGGVKAVQVPFTQNAWHHLVWQPGGISYLNMYADGVSGVAVTSGIQAPNLDSMHFAVGASHRAVDDNYEKGTMDEVRISNILRSADWILTEYNNQKAPGNIGADNFIKFGAETGGAGRIHHKVTGGE